MGIPGRLDGNHHRTGEGSLNLAAGAYGGKLINSGAGSLVIGAGNATLGGGISGTVVKTGDGTLSLSRDAFNASAGGTLVVESGTLAVAAEGTLSSDLNDHPGRKRGDADRLGHQHHRHGHIDDGERFQAAPAERER